MVATAIEFEIPWLFPEKSLQSQEREFDLLITRMTTDPIGRQWPVTN